MHKSSNATLSKRSPSTTHCTNTSLRLHVATTSNRLTNSMRRHCRTCIYSIRICVGRRGSRASREFLAQISNGHNSKMVRIDPDIVLFSGRREQENPTEQLPRTIRWRIRELMGSGKDLDQDNFCACLSTLLQYLGTQVSIHPHIVLECRPTLQGRWVATYKPVNLTKTLWIGPYFQSASGTNHCQ